MPINYNTWFYDYHKYLKGTKPGNDEYNDTKWVYLGNRYQKLIELGSDIIHNQPYGVVGNKYAFDRLMELLGNSNYAFSDVNDALIDTYKVNLRNAMSRMLVNTHNVLYACKSTDKRVYTDPSTHKYVIEVPFDQMHFGERDEFIRQKIEKMHETYTDLYLSRDEFYKSDISDLLEFTIICTTNGYISNDFDIALSEKGLRFKIGWNHSEDCNFIIYKLDKAYVTTFENMDASSILQYDGIGDLHLTLQNPKYTNGSKLGEYVGCRCLVDIYDPNFIKATGSVVNFGIIRSNGVDIRKLQPKTKHMVGEYHSKEVNVTIYVLDYFHEVSGVYPAINYMDMMDQKLVYTDHDNQVDTEDGNRVLMTSGKNRNMLEPCTPPICIDRPVKNAFDSFAKCMNLYNTMMDSERLKEMNEVYLWFHISECDPSKYADISIALRSYYDAIKPYYDAYVKCAIITSLIDQSYVDQFKTFMNNIQGLLNIRTIDEADDYAEVDEFTGYYREFVNTLYEPFTNEKLQPFEILNIVSDDYYHENDDRFNRPVSEQSFISFQYDREEECWLFCNPEIRHFTGIGNTFYINSKLNGDEIFKFFVLYSDTEAPSEETVDDDFPMNVVMDFDKFYQEVDKHMGFIRYWYAENKLAKLSYINETKYDEETSIQMLSKILKHKIEGRDLLYEYDSDMDYEESRMSSDNLNAGEYDKQAPFAINFLFYTLSLLQDNEDKLQAYFYRQLTHKKFNPRYADLNINSYLSNQCDTYINTAMISVIPNNLNNNACDKTNMSADGKNHVYTGLPYIFRNQTIQGSNYYPYTFNIYHDGDVCKLIDDSSLDHNHYITLEHVDQIGWEQLDSSTDAKLVRLITYYLTAVYDTISYIETNYANGLNKSSYIESRIKYIRKCILNIRRYSSGRVFLHPNATSIIDSITIDNPIINALNLFKQRMLDILMISSTSKGNVYRTINKYLLNMEKVYKSTGFKQHYLKRARRTYVHLKKLNKPMNLFKYNRYWNEMDMQFIGDKTRKYISENPTSYSTDIFAWGDKIVRDKNNDVEPSIQALQNLYDNSFDTIRSNHLTSIKSFCDDVIQNYIFEVYMIDEIRMTSKRLGGTKPAYVTLTMPSSHTTYHSQSITTNTIVFHPQYEYDNGIYILNGLIPIMYYAFFNSSNLVDTPYTVYDDSGNAIDSGVVSMTFMKVGSSANHDQEIKLLNPAINTKIDVQNIHEVFDVLDENISDKIVNDKYGIMNYELLFHNKFYPLNHTSELVRHVKGQLPGSIDRTYLQNYQLNQIALKDHNIGTNIRMYFKPSQIMHLNRVGRNYIESIGGGNFINQRVYLKTLDGTNYIFPAKVTTIDHNIGHGILELEVCSRDAKWLQLDDTALITDYLNNAIQCEIIPDNISNFLNEFSNDTYGMYNPCKFDLDEEYCDETFEECYSFPGDPLFVDSNTDYVYTRLHYPLNDLVDNRFIDNDHKTYQFIYMGACDSRLDIDDGNHPVMYLSFLKHHFNMLSNPEMYPILREEPNDHSVWNAEKKLFDQLILDYNIRIIEYTEQIASLKHQYQYIYTAHELTEKPDKWPTGYYVNTRGQGAPYGFKPGTYYTRQYNTDFKLRQTIQLRIEDLEQKREYANERSKTIQIWRAELEKPSTWFNVQTYDAADTYVHNGRAYLSQSFQEDIRDIPLFSELELFIYDWEHHHWVDPSLYTFDKTPYSGSNHYYAYDNPDEFLSNNVFDKSIITLKPGFPKSKKLLMYLAFNTSKFTLIGQPEMPQTCRVQFKPILSLSQFDESSDLFANLKLRKVFDIDEEYTFSSYNAPESFSRANAFHVIRNRRTGKTTYSPTVRLCDVNVINNNNEYDISKFNVFIKNPFLDINTNQIYRYPTFTSLTYLPMDDFKTNQSIKLICIQNTPGCQYDGVMSNIMFEATTGSSINSPIKVHKSSVPYLTNGSYLCTVYMDSSYACKGGIYKITVSHTGESLMDANQNWIRIPDTTSVYRELPDEFLLQPKSISLTGETIIQLKSTYDSESQNLIYEDNDGRTNLMEFMYDTNQHVRLPMSDTIKNNPHKRFTVNTLLNPVKTVHTTYVNVCRYSLNTIPQDGFIDVTGYVPTPLTRERYEWWVNGRYVNDDVVILSPTSFQLTNLKSLHNFELIELVDDVDDSQLMLQSNMYVGLNGKLYSSYEAALLSNQDIIQQDIRYTFNAYPNHTKLQDFSKGIVNPNNKDVEINILNGYVSNTASSYEDLYNYPTINGVQLHHVTTEQMGLYEIPFNDIIKEYDKVWKKEILNNELFPMTHRDSTMMSDTYNRIHVHESDKYDGMFVVHVYGLEQKYHTLYISTLEDGGIDETDYTQKIIPFVKNGTRVHIDGKYRGMWIHTTAPNYKSIQIK